MIHLHQPPAAPRRVRYALNRTDAGDVVPVLTLAHGAQALDAANWAVLRADGATLTAGTARELGIVRQVLGAHCGATLAAQDPTP